MTRVYHTVKHNLSYNSADCAHKLNQKILVDSKIVKKKKITVGRTKPEAVVKEVLGPKAVMHQIKANGRCFRLLMSITVQNVESPTKCLISWKMQMSLLLGL
ncbi:hypothetical protein XENOCAPTIV_005136 [Xenoophorus captivus]|uniref:Uncharacterized protein n=1 Tax=Xenoophorus captivus TaxID=1517983 RepID=A0ABV0QUT5_9TELE